MRWTENEKHRQAHAWGSAEWRDEYAKRSRIEGAFGTVKSRGGLVKGWIHVLGLVKTSLMTMLLCAAHNLRLRANAGTTFPDCGELLVLSDGSVVNTTTGEVTPEDTPPQRT